MWGPALSGYMSLSTPSRTLQEESIQLHAAGSVQGQQTTFSRKLASKHLALRVSPDKQMVTVCTQGECYQAVIISKAAICPPNRSQGERKKLYHFHPWTRIPLRATFHLVSTQSPGERVPSTSVNVNLYFFPSAPLIYFSFFSFTWSHRLLPSLRLTAVQMTCCPSCPSWLCGASVHSCCLNAPLWRSSFMKGESWWKKMVNDRLLCLHQIHRNLPE